MCERSVPVRVAVDARWWTVGGPTSVCNTGMAVKDFVKIWLLLLDQSLQLSNFSHLFEGKDLVLLVTIDCQTS